MIGESPGDHSVSRSRRVVLRSGGAVDPHLLAIKMSAAIISLTLTEADLLLLIKSEVLHASLKDLGSLKSHLDSCRANRVRARIVDCSGRLVHKTDMVYSVLAPSRTTTPISGLSTGRHRQRARVPFVQAGVPSVGRLRSELTAHFEQVEASYCEEVQEAINTVGQRVEVDEDYLLNTDGSGLGTFSRSRIDFDPTTRAGRLALSDPTNPKTRFLLDGIAFRSRSLSCGPVVGEFFFSNNRGGNYKTEPEAVHFLLRSANWDPSLRDGGRPRGDGSLYFCEHYCFRSGVDEDDGGSQGFSAFCQYVMGAVRDDSLELILGPEVFHVFDARGAPWVATFSSLEVKKRFVEFVEILELARKIDIEDPGSRHFGMDIATIVTRIMHKPEILRRLEEPHRSNFDNNDWWYLTRNCADLAFSLMAAESVDESQNRILSDNHTSLVDLIGAPEVFPDEDGDDEQLIQLRITTSRQAGH